MKNFYTNQESGRAGYEYDTERNEDTGKLEIYKSGVKMKAAVAAAPPVNKLGPEGTPRARSAKKAVVEPSD